MPLSVPNLDDRNFADLVEEARSMVPQYAPQWTNHNAADPGVTLIELLAYVSEILIYRLNRITRESKLKFLQLLREVTPAEMKDLKDPNTSMEKVDGALSQTVQGLRKLQRAVSAQDYEDLIKNFTAPSDQAKVVRSCCFSGMNLETSGNESQPRDCPGHVSVVIVPDRELDVNELASLLKQVHNELEPMRLLTTRLHIVKPFYLWLSLGAEIRIQPGAKFDEVRKKAICKVQEYFNPLPDTATRREGWPFGRNVYLSEVYAQLEEVNGVDYVRNVRALHLSEKSEAVDEERSAIGIQIGVPAASTIGINTRLGGETSGDVKRLVSDARGTLIAVALKAYELVKIVVREGNLLPTDN